MNDAPNHEAMNETAANEPHVNGPDASVAQETRPTPIPWSGLDVMAIVGLVIAANIITFIILGQVMAIGTLLAPETDPDSIFSTLMGTTLLLFIQWVATLGVTVLFLTIKGYRLSAGVLGFRKTRLGRAILWFLLVMFLFFFVNETLYAWIIEMLDPSLLPEQDISQEYGRDIVGYLAAVTQVALLVPVLEELFFRGIIHQGLEKRFGFIRGALLSSAIFALAHVDPAVYFPIFVLGFGFALLLHKTRSLWPSIAGHFLVNIIAVSGQFYLDGSSAF